MIKLKMRKLMEIEDGNKFGSPVLHTVSGKSCVSSNQLETINKLLDKYFHSNLNFIIEHLFIPYHQTSSRLSPLFF